MRDSDTYMMIIEEGMEEGEKRALQRTLLRQGRKRFGEANEATRAAILAVTSVERLERLSEALLDVSSWQELLDQP